MHQSINFRAAFPTHNDDASRPPRNSSTAINSLLPGPPGTMRLVDRFGDALLYVRYRHDPLRNYRPTTMELIVKERPSKPERTAWIRVAYGETELRQHIKEAGSAWHPPRKLWLLLVKTIKAMKLETRMVTDV